MADEPFPYLTKHSTDISVRWTPPQDLVQNQSDISMTCLSTSSFYKVFDNDKNSQCGINHGCTVTSQNASYVNYTGIEHRMKS